MTSSFFLVISAAVIFGFWFLLCSACLAKLSSSHCVAPANRQTRGIRGRPRSEPLELAHTFSAFATVSTTLVMSASGKCEYFSSPEVALSL